MDSNYISKRQLCKRCVTWDFDQLFQGRPDNAHRIGPFHRPESMETWDIRLLEEVQQNINCKLCQFIYSVVISSPAWKHASGSTSELYLHYRKQWLGHRFEFPNEAITTLALEPLNSSDPGKRSPTDFSKYPGLQCFLFKSYQQYPQFSQILAGRQMDSIIDFGLLKYWITSCNGHGMQCPHQTLTGDTNSRIRFVDVKSRRLVWATTSEVYAALSYIWGPPSLQQTRLTRSTQAGLFLDGAFGDEIDTIPRTIRDAMIVCEQLAIPHLWVDALCIEQDSPDFSVHLRIMNDIYAAAYLTIVAASGADSWAGLPGLMPNSREVQQPSINIKGLGISLAVPEFWGSVINSPWANRGWTFQERLFSKRMLIFAETQCFFYCDKASRFESTITEVDHGAKGIKYSFSSLITWMDMRTKFKADLLGLSKGETLKAYFQLVRDYRRLTLTYQEDVLRAFSGVMTTFERQMSTSFYFGLLLALFTWALMTDYTQCVRRPHFPSWSWTGWSEDRFEYGIRISLHNFRTTIICYRLQATFNNANAEDKWILEAISDSDTPGSVDAHCGVDSVLFDQHLPTQLNRGSLEKLLVLGTLSSKIEVSPDSIYSRSMELGRQFDIDNNMTFGRLAPFNHSADDPDDHFSEEPYLSWSYFTESLTGSSNSRLLEFIQIGKYISTWYEWNVVYLMLVNTDEQGISTRVSSCSMREELWSRSSPQRKRVYLT